MSFTEKHKTILTLLGGFLLLLFLVWLFYLRGNASRTAEDNAHYRKQISANIEKFTNKNATALVSKLSADYAAATEELGQRFKAVSESVLWKFPVPLIPADAMPQSYVRVRLRDERDYAARQLSTVKNIRLSASAKQLGMDLPADVSSETLKVDEGWMRQILVVRRFVDVLLSLPEEKPNEQPILAIDLLRPLPPVDTGTPPAFLREHPVEVTMQMTMGGLMRLLAACSQDKTMHVIRSLEISSDPEERLSRFGRRDDPEKKVQNRWFTHYHTVHLVVASVEALDGKEKEKAAAAKPVQTGPRRAILH
ncbi:MAG: hypothetical protein J6333_07940 [Planctomycetes bacterium]|nr:hypothetical protein [Planctomycetota bacterium]